jgi:hypothetical protein
MNTPTRQALEHINRCCGIAGTHPYFRSRRLLAEQVTRMLAEGMTFDPSSADWAAFGEGGDAGPPEVGADRDRGDEDPGRKEAAVKPYGLIPRVELVGAKETGWFSMYVSDDPEKMTDDAGSRARRVKLAGRTIESAVAAAAAILDREGFFTTHAEAYAGDRIWMICLNPVGTVAHYLCLVPLDRCLVMDHGVMLCNWLGKSGLNEEK